MHTVNGVSGNLMYVNHFAEIAVALCPKVAVLEFDCILFQLLLLPASVGWMDVMATQAEL